MSYIIGKQMIGRVPVPTPLAGGGPTVGGAPLPKVGSIITANNGAWYGGQGGSTAYNYQWYLGTRTAYASATLASYSISAADAGSYLTVRVGLGNKYGTNYRNIATGTIIP